VQRIEPGANTWMTAGRGLVHSARTPEDQRGQVRRSHGLQRWTALPAEAEEVEPAFVHTPADAIPVHRADGCSARVLVGDAYGLRSPVQPLSPTLYVDYALGSGDGLPVPPAEERALYGVDAPFLLDGVEVAPLQMVLLAPGETPLLAAKDAARVVLIGGAPLGHRHINWNFVSTRRERIEQAREDWRHGRFGAVPGETEFIPLPGG
jgi:redox-sensitive bicupin YhaK (pirin superfamily)